MSGYKATLTLDGQQTTIEVVEIYKDGELYYPTAASEVDLLGLNVFVALDDDAAEKAVEFLCGVHGWAWDFNDSKACFVIYGEQFAGEGAKFDWWYNDGETELWNILDWFADENDITVIYEADEDEFDEED